MRLRFVWLALPLLSACTAAPRGDSAEAVCQRQALDDPAVKQLTIQQMDTGAMSPKANFDYNHAIHRAYQACLIQHGVAVRGGVESVRPTY